jgi:hypothetical protein
MKSLLMTPVPMRSLRRLMAAAAVACGITAATLAAASSQAAVVSTTACDGSALSKPFLPWGDSNLYKIVPGGDFEGDLSAWTLTGGAKKVAGSDPYAVTGTPGASSLSLPAGSSAQTPFTCVNAAYPTFRFMARNTGLLGTVLVQVVYHTPLGVTVVAPVGAVALSGSWQPTLAMLTASAVPAALSGGTAQLAIRFTEVTGTSQIDDVFVDPRGV